MTFRQWFMVLAVYGTLQILMSIGEASGNLIGSDDVNNSIGFQVDTESSGTGFIGYLRNVISFFTDLLPKLIWWNYGVLNGDLEIVQWFLTLAFGGAIVAATVGQRVLGGR